MAYSNLSRNDEAEQCLRRALAIEPDDAAANFNLGLLLGEEGRLGKADRGCGTRGRAIRKWRPRLTIWACGGRQALARRGPCLLPERRTRCPRGTEVRPHAGLLPAAKGSDDQAIDLLRR